MSKIHKRDIHPLLIFQVRNSGTISGPPGPSSTWPAASQLSSAPCPGRSWKTSVEQLEDEHKRRFQMKTVGVSTIWKQQKYGLTFNKICDLTTFNAIQPYVINKHLWFVKNVRPVWWTHIQVEYPRSKGWCSLEWCGGNPIQGSYYTPPKCDPKYVVQSSTMVFGGLSSFSVSEVPIWKGIMIVWKLFKMMLPKTGLTQSLAQAFRTTPMP